MFSTAWVDAPPETACRKSGQVGRACGNAGRGDRTPAKNFGKEEARPVGSGSRRGLDCSTEARCERTSQGHEQWRCQVTDCITNLRKPNYRRALKMNLSSDYTVSPSGITSPRVQETSRAAMDSQDPGKKSRREQQILEYIDANGGATCCEVEEAIGLLHQSASSTITGLRKAGRLVDTGKRRPTNTGCMAIVWGVAQ